MDRVLGINVLVIGIVVLLLLLFQLSSCGGGGGGGGGDDDNSVSFYQGIFKPLYGELNIIPYEEEGGNSWVQISMDEKTSAGFKSNQNYMHGYFETSLKLPKAEYTAGVVVTFYTCNNYKNHDEIDLEFLGHNHGHKWTLQTNFYGNGSTNRGREERYYLWFDPSEDFHRYGILWTANRITYYVDDVPIRDVKRPAVDSIMMGDDFPSKEMSLYGTIWNGSDWATNGGRDKLDLRYGPFIANYSYFTIINQTQTTTTTTTTTTTPTAYPTLTRKQRRKMNVFRRKWMTYSYCYDRRRYAVPLPECVCYHNELQHLHNLHPRTFGSAGNCW